MFKNTRNYLVTLKESFLWAIIAFFALVFASFDWLSIGKILSYLFNIKDENLKASIQLFIYIVSIVVISTAGFIIWDLLKGLFNKKSKEEDYRIDIIPKAGIPMVLNRSRYQSAELEIVNLDDQIEITDCIATLIELKYLRRNIRLGWVCVIPSIMGQPDRIRWNETIDSNAQCEIRIPAIDSRHINLADTLDSRILGFNLRAGKFAPSEGPEEDSMPAYSVIIRVDGKRDGKPMKPQRFDGYLYWETRKLKTIIKGQSPSGRKFENIHEVDSIPLLMFEKGYWMKSKKIKKILGIVDNKEKVSIKENFLRYLKKVSCPKKNKSLSEKAKENKSQ